MKIKFWVNQYTTKEGNRTFFKTSIKGKFIPSEIKEKANKKGLKVVEDAFYTIALVQHQAPTTAGFFEIDCEDAWIDTREGYSDKNILRLKGITEIRSLTKEPLTEGK